jgi:hypothetical protein
VYLDLYRYPARLTHCFNKILNIFVLAVPARCVPFPVGALRRRGVEQVYTHQAEAFSRVVAGQEMRKGLRQGKLSKIYHL